jgi:hypothetical protein
MNFNWEQSSTALSDMFPPLWKALYDKCIAEGFTEAQAMELLKVFILSNGTPRFSL